MDHEGMLQMKFEQTINLLIMYKQSNNEKDVFLSEKSIKEAINWYKNNILKNINQ
tara:strand:- start:366 stop:530 length:165 start_codon:yes stop_codon:yes gene_type:complete